MTPTTTKERLDGNECGTAVKEYTGRVVERRGFGSQSILIFLQERASDWTAAAIGRICLTLAHPKTQIKSQEKRSKCCYQLHFSSC
jgi:hypothetical protein